MIYEIMHKHYIKELEKWIKASGKYCYRYSQRNDLECYGYGDSGHWSVQTNLKAFAAYAVAGSDSAYDCRVGEMSRHELIARSLRTLRFAFETHIEGGYQCVDGKSWGHSWISALGLERAMHGVEAIEEYLTDSDKELMQKVLISECNWLMDHYDITAGPVENNRPESNIWNGAMLYRTAEMYPDTPRAESYKEKGTSFLINGISVPSDAFSDLPIDGKPMCQWHIGNNYFETYSLNHHRYLNIGYMVICLSNIAMLHFFYKNKGIKAPDALYHHATDLWNVVKNFIFPDGRLIRVGGDTRVRYCYCQDYIIPVCLMMIDYYKDNDCISFEVGWMEQVKKEMFVNEDGTYLSKRCKDIKKASPVYYTRLESDRAVSISMGAYWRRIFDLPYSSDTDTREHTSSWHDSYHGSLFHRNNNRIASWTWEAGEPPQGLCLPVDRSDLAEWRENLAGQIQGLGALNYHYIQSHKEIEFEGGFLTYGNTIVKSEQMAAEGQSDEDMCLHQIVFAALPDDTTIVAMQYCTTLRRTYISSLKGLFLQVPNDLFNNNMRNYFYNGGSYKLKGVGSNEEAVLLNSKWLNIDDCLGVIGVYKSENITIKRPGKRQIGLRFQPHLYKTGGMLYADEICYPYHKPGLVDADTVVLDIGFMLQSNITHKETRKYYESRKCKSIKLSESFLRSMTVIGADGKEYLLIANFGEEKITAKVPLKNTVNINSITDCCWGYEKEDLVCKLGAHSAQLFQIES